MRKCLYVNNPVRHTLRLIIPPIIFILYDVIFVTFFSAAPTFFILFFVPLLTIMLGVAAFTLGYLMLYFRKYEFTADGLRIQFFNWKPKCYAWDDIKEIGICKVHYTSRAPYDYTKVFRCTLKEENPGPKDGYGIWATELYHVLHMRKVIILDYSYLLHEQLEKDCPRLISDYLHIRKNAYDTY